MFTSRATSLRVFLIFQLEARRKLAQTSNSQSGLEMLVISHSPFEAPREGLRQLSNLELE